MEHDQQALAPDLGGLPLEVEQLAQLDAEKIAVETAMRQAAQEAVERHRQAGQPLVVWRDGQIALVPAHQVSPEGGVRPH